MRQKEYTEQLLPLAKEVFPMACRLVGDDAQAEDIVQEVMLTLWHKRKQLHIKTSYKSFLYKTVRNRCLDWLKQQKTKPTQSLENVGELSTLPPENFDTMQWIAFCIEQLPEQQRQIICMREIDGLEFREISELLELKESNVRMLLSRAKKRLREKLEKLWGEF